MRRRRAFTTRSRGVGRHRRTRNRDLPSEVRELTGDERGSSYEVPLRVGHYSRSETLTEHDVIRKKHKFLGCCLDAVDVQEGAEHARQAANQPIFS